VPTETIVLPKEIQADEAEINGLIIDLRNNTGGLLDVATDICDMFLPEELLIVSTKGRGKVVLQEFSSTPQLALNPSVPICILVNRNSASASEILAGCLQDHGRAIVIGEQTWGKGTVQNVIPIRRGESALKLTTASYWRPSGKSIDRHDEISKKTNVWGIQPNEGFEIEVEEEQVFENMRQRNLRDLRGLLTEEESEMINQLRVYEPSTDEEVDGSEGGQADDQVDDAAEQPATDEATQAQDDNTDAQPQLPHVDKALERAIEHFETIVKSKHQIAA